MMDSVKRINTFGGYLFLAIILITFPFREGIAFSSGEDSYVRFGEILFLISPFFYFSYRKEASLKRCSISNFILIFIIFALVFDLLLGRIVNLDYAIKFIIRGVLVFFFIRICEKSNLVVNSIFFDKLFKYTVILQSIFCFIQLFGFDIKGLSFRDYEDVVLGGVHRFRGTASEPGYMIPILAPCFFYFLQNLSKYLMWVILTGFLMVFSFSSFGFAAFFIILFINYAQDLKKSILKIFIWLIVLVGLSFIIASFSPIVSDAIDKMFEKIFSFIIGDQYSMDWSAMERTANREAAIKAFSNLDLFEKFFGAGLGATEFYTNKYVLIYYTGEEAHNIYLALLLNTGFVGVSLLLFSFFYIFKQKRDQVISKSLFIGIFIQMIQYYIVGNIWLYFFWFEIGLLILFNRSLKKCDCLNN